MLAALLPPLRRPRLRRLRRLLRPVSRRCRGGRGRGPGAGPATTTARPGRGCAACVTTPSPTSAAIRTSSLPASSRSWVAHAVDSASTVSSPSSSFTGRQCAATSGADDLLPLAEDRRLGRRLLPAARLDQLGEQRAERLRVARVGPGAGVAAQPAAARHRRRRRRRRRGGDLAPRERRVERGAGQLRAGQALRDAAGRRCYRSTRQPRRTSPSAPRTGRPRSARRHVVVDRAGDEHLLGAGDQVGEPLPAAGVELGEHVVERRAPARCRRRAAARTRPAAAPARTTRTRRGWRSPWPAGRRASAPGRRGAGRPA